MALIDEVTIYAESGNGGDGVIRWRRTKRTARGGPSGGDGGKGGDVIVVGVRDIAALAYYRYKKTFRAGDGEDGRGEQERGADGESIFLAVPIGTLVHVIETGEEYEVMKEDERIALFRGGRGGFGNARFKSSTNQNPFQQSPGKKGKGGRVKLTLKLIADAGLIGLPNAGKSSLLNTLTRARSKVAAYPFTTLEPGLGELDGYILADIPGLIKDASLGRGLGIKFLKHVERTGVLLHLVSADQDDPVAAYREIRREIETFGYNLAKKSEIIILSKTDLVSPETCETKMRILARATGREVLPVSIKDSHCLRIVANRLTNILQGK